MSDKMIIEPRHGFRVYENHAGCITLAKINSSMEILDYMAVNPEDLPAIIKGLKDFQKDLDEGS